MEGPPELLKSFANRLAHFAVSEDGAEVIRLLRLTGLFAQQSKPIADQPSNGTMSIPPARPSDPDRVGIWERKSKDSKSFFVRRMDKANEWSNWASVGRIDSKGAKRRVVLIGESVARGYLYDPQFNPAKALDLILQSRLGKGEVEVIDLARTDLGYEFQELTQSAILLSPDVVIIFAGNNWRRTFSFDPSNLDQVRQTATTLREQGVTGCKRLIEEQLSIVLRQLVRTVASFYEARGIPLVWIVPEFNLGDWRDPETNAPHLQDGANLQWITCWEKAQNLMRDGDIIGASESAKKLIELDKGVNATGFHILAQHSQELGDEDAARRYLEMARDSVIWDTSRIISPRPYKIVQDAMRAEVKEGLVNLPDLFKEHLRGGLPDRRLFLDYCHLNSDGIRIAMAAAASCVLRSLKGVAIPWNELADQSIAPSQELEAEASFLAAIHNAHFWQSCDVVEHYCLRAVQASPKIGQIMTDFIDLQSRRAPMLMCRSAERLAGSESSVIAHYLLRNNKQFLDKLLLDAVLRALKKLGIEARRRLEQIRREEHSVADRTINLLDPYYLSAALQSQELYWALPMAEKSLFQVCSDYYQAYWLESRFVFVGERDRPVRLCLTCRLPGPGQPVGTIHIEVNGIQIGEANIDRDWGTWEIDIPGQVVGAMNDIVIRWPVPEFPGEKALGAVADALVDGISPKFFPLFGEIHAFTASDELKFLQDNG